MRLIGKPEGVGTMIAVMPDAVSGGKAVSAVIRKGYRPRALEFLDRAALDHVRPRAPFTFPADAGAIVLIELDGEPEAMEAAVLRCGAVCEEEGAREVIVARDDADREAPVEDAPAAARASLREAHAFKLSEDIVVPPGSIAEMLRRVDGIGARNDLLMATFGHAGDGNLHVNVLTDENHRDTGVAARIDAALGEIFRATLDLKGHAVGRARHRHRQGASTWPGSSRPRSSTGRSASSGCGIRRSCSTRARSSSPGIPRARGGSKTRLGADGSGWGRGGGNDAQRVTAMQQPLSSNEPR